MIHPPTTGVTELFFGGPLVQYSIAGYRRTLVLDNRTAYHRYFDFLRLETGFEQLSGGGYTDSGGGTATKRNGLIFIRWTHIDLGA
jgi:hypothetical protein